MMGNPTEIKKQPSIKKHKRWITFGLSMLFLLCIAEMGSANSSWRWLTNYPYTLLPIGIIMTLLIEIVGIRVINPTTTPEKVWISIVVSNIASFIAPYMFIGLTPRIFEEDQNFFRRINEWVSAGPVYNVGLAFLLITCIVEIPIVYLVLNTDVTKQKRLLLTILAVNVISTLAVFIIERTLCKGYW
jgi:hypothetical protein